MRIAYLGPSGSFTHQVATKSFPKETLQSFESITEVIKAYEYGDVDYAVIPVENTIEGSVHETIDYLFHQADLQAVAEVIQPIKQQLLALRKHHQIDKVYSHPQAIAQGKKYIMEHFPEAEFEMTASTAYAARFVAEHPDKAYAAIAPEAAASQYGLQIIAKDIQEVSDNVTRFWILGKQTPVFELEKGPMKMSLALTLPNNLPGALYKALSVFSWRGINMTKIESRPLKTVLGEYFFMIDLSIDKQEILDYAFQELTSIGIKYKILGIYNVYQC